MSRSLFVAGVVALVACSLTSSMHAQSLWLHVADDVGASREARGLLTQRLTKAGLQVVSNYKGSLEHKSSVPHRSIDELVLLLSEVEGAFHGGRTAEALTHLATAQTLSLEFSRSAYSLRTEIEIWRCAIYQSEGNSIKAQEHALRALALDRDLIIDLQRYWPSLAEFFEEHRAKVSSARLVLTDLPLGAEIWIDGRQAPREVELGVGSHSAFVQAKGYQSRSVQFNLSSDTILPFALESSIDIAEALCRSSSLPLCVLVSRVSGWQAITVDMRSSPVQRISQEADSLTGLAQLLVEQFTVPNTTARSHRLFLRTGLQVFANQALSASWATSTLEQSSESGGIIVGLGWHDRSGHEGSFATADLALKRIFAPRIHQQGLDVDPDFPSRGVTSWALSGELQAGYRSSFGSGRYAISPRLALALDSYRYQDLKIDGSKLGVFAPATTIALSPGLDLQVRVSPALSLAVQVFVGVFSTYLEAPAGYGESAPPSSGSARGRVSWRLSDTWEIETMATIMGYRSEFSGAGSARLTPAPQDVNIDFVDARLELSLYREL